jgi:cytochrome c oxidase cbb3-type subunit III
MSAGHRIAILFFGSALILATPVLGQDPTNNNDNARSNGPQVPAEQSLSSSPEALNGVNTATNANILNVPLVENIPGGVKIPNIENPMAHDPQSAQRGMMYFEKMNCVGCHAANGAGGMGPSLSDESTFKYPTDPASLYAVISHGAPLGMPAWGTVLPHNVIWDIVSYIESINKDPTSPWGHTVSPAVHQPDTQQVPAEFQQTTTPWQYLEQFTNGKAPTGNPPETEVNDSSTGTASGSGG